MGEKASWEYYKYKRYLNIISRKYFHFGFPSYAGKRIMPSEQGNQWIREAVERGTPFVAARFGSTELASIVGREAIRLGKNAVNTDSNICIYSGFFPEDKEYVDRFVEMSLNEIAEVDLLGIWYKPQEEFVIDYYMRQTIVTPIEAIEPYAYQNPWSASLNGKKVLVIHPFKESIIEQYKKHEKLFPGTDVLPDFELKTIKAVQSLAKTRDDRFETWFDALDYMKRQMEQIEFDIAIIGCGAYGMPLAIHAKRMGKQAVHMGGATQILFGIKGRRWDDNKIISRLYNENWIRPNNKETIQGQDMIENGCYW